ncbi:hypothetical protein [Tumebacillus lipolyticus]|uniref:Uncharacterized protein n=1 Tax=Tumebacillus lipolyticus TaxID=1280370 RepID=A0ABW4ZUB3_9BACL
MSKLPPERTPSHFDESALHQLFRMQPEHLTHGQMVRRELFPRWEVIRPTGYNPVDAETKRIQELLAESNQQLH